MKKRINLITKQKKYRDIEKFFNNLRLMTFISVGLFIALSLGIFLLLSREKNELDKVNAEKKDLYQYVVQNKEAEAKFVYFRNKEKQVSEILEDDVNFYPYYVVLDESLKQSTQSAILEALTIDKTREADFTISFNEYESLISFFKFFESEEFLKNFDELSVIKFNPIESATVYNINFTGKFKKL